MQGGSHGDRCVKELSWRQGCTIVKEHVCGGKCTQNARGVLLTVAAGVVLQFVCVF